MTMQQNKLTKSFFYYVSPLTILLLFILTVFIINSNLYTGDTASWIYQLAGIALTAFFILGLLITFIRAVFKTNLTGIWISEIIITATLLFLYT